MASTPSQLSHNVLMLQRDQAEARTVVDIRARRLPPLSIFEIPADRLRNAICERFLRSPSKLAMRLRSIDGVALVVSGPVRDKPDERAPRHRSRHCPVDGVADLPDNIDIALLAIAAKIVLLAGPAARQQRDKPFGMILNMQPIPDVGAGSVNRQRLALDGIEYGQRDELFRKLAWSIIVRAVRHDNRQAIGLEPCQREVIGGRLAGRIW